ncbi:hypothetical protein M378DRAFT_74364 [Amanita muscaria Koide BX008]|uniref:Uncharacterized protein n=1 Tax=Amanita muscaria (strain Koide BX008) TaxID=946122 RepID=A0A0C2SUR2_AMAMK|nr:hypothetical protein M378DRAFT_74364 [Amanita muscaria Koide BX008]
MITLARPILRTTTLLRGHSVGAFRYQSTAPLKLARPMPRVTLAVKYTGAILSRSVASSVSGKPGSQSLKHAATNIKEEVGNSAADLAKVIAANDPNMRAKDSVDPTGAASFYGITRKMWAEVPTPMMVLGLSGGVPYVAAAATTAYLAHAAGLAAMGLVPNVDPAIALALLHRALEFQVTYGAVLLSFLGAMHWGLEIAGYGGPQGYARLALGAAPILIAWPTLAMEPITALIVQWLGFTALWLADAKATMAGWTPRWYAQYRFYLSLLVGTCIIGSIACTAYWGPVAGHGVISHSLEKSREERRKLMPARSGTVPGPVEAMPAEEKADHFVRVHNKERDAKGK